MMVRENMFTINLDSDSIIDEESLIIRRESEALNAQRNELNDQLGTAISKNIHKQVWLYILPCIAMILAIPSAWTSLTEYFSSGVLPVLSSVLALLFLFVATVSFLLCRSKSKKEDGDLDGDLDRVDDAYDALNECVKLELHVPENAKSIEVFTDMYSNDDSAQSGVYSTDTVEVFEENGKLCFFYGSVVLGVPISRIESVVKVDAPIIFDSWDKEIPHDQGEYMQYNIQEKKINEYEEHYSMRGYYSVRFMHDDQPYEILVPLYEMAPILEILKLEPITE